MIPRSYRLGRIIPLVLLPLCNPDRDVSLPVPEAPLLAEHEYLGIALPDQPVSSPESPPSAVCCFCRYLEARSLLASIVESSDDGIIGTGLDGIVFSWNKGAEKIYGYSAAEVLGKPVSILLPPDRPDDQAQILQKISLGRQGRTLRNGPDSKGREETLRCP